jgi:hypothetical protein
VDEDSLTLKRTARAEADAGPVSTDGLGDGLHNLERKATEVLDRTAISIGPLVADILDKLFDELSIRSCIADIVSKSDQQV